MPKTIGVFGGSFNPPHAGHIHVSRKACEILKLDKLIWLITPCNSFKSPEDYIPFDARVKMCKMLIRSMHDIKTRISLSKLEQRRNITQTIDSIRIIKKHNPTNKIIWIMGADNLKHFHTWQNWQEIFHYADVSVFDREQLLSSEQKNYQQTETMMIAKRNNLPLKLHKIDNLDLCATDIRHLALNPDDPTTKTQSSDLKAIYEAYNLDYHASYLDFLSKIKEQLHNNKQKHASKIAISSL